MSETPRGVNNENPGRLAGSPETTPGTAATVLPAEPVWAAAHAADQAVTEPAHTSLAEAHLDLTAPDPREIEAWNEQVRRRMRRHSRRAFLGLGAGLAAAAGIWSWLITQREIDGVPWPLRKTLEVNEQLARDFFSEKRLAPEVGKDRVSPDRVNGNVGLDSDIDLTGWRLRVEGLDSQSAPLALTLDAIRKLSRVEMTTELKCIEGWSVAVHWAGARFTDFMKAFPPATVSGAAFSPDRPDDWPPFVRLETPGGDYYVGLDMESMLHPQTLLCYERNDEPLSRDHGAPLRLVIPVKYGVKNIKRIGTLRYTTRRPADYWAEQGYDWYIGL
jgi:DMSO/TMAO reductase YedYZ molybdopterin-dependent catalytic subunit